MVPRSSAKYVCSWEMEARVRASELPSVVRVLHRSDAALLFCTSTYPPKQTGECFCKRWSPCFGALFAASVLEVLAVRLGLHPPQVLKPLRGGGGRGSGDSVGQAWPDGIKSCKQSLS